MTPSDPVPLAPRDLLILSALAAGPLHGYGIVRAVEERSEVLLDPANLYRSLRRMRRDRWIRESDGGEDDDRGRRRRAPGRSGSAAPAPAPGRAGAHAGAPRMSRGPLAPRAYRALLRLMPRRVRARDGEDTARTFAAMWADA